MRNLLTSDPVRDPISYSHRSSGYAWRGGCRGLAVAGVALSASILVGAAAAADLPLKAAAAAAVVHLTRCYIGVNGGGAAGGSDFTSRVDPGTHLIDPGDLVVAAATGSG